jgi:hypothetical protein
MSFLKTDYSEVNTGFEALPVGEYECIISAVEIVKTKTTDKNMLKVTLTVRDDVDQTGGKRKFFDNLVEQDNMMWKFQQLAKAAQLPAGQDIESLQSFAKEIQYKSVRIKNKHRTYEGEIQDTIAHYVESQVGGGEAAGRAAADPFASGNGAIEVSDDDLPF